jgi:hypothetical protein
MTRRTSIAVESLLVAVSLAALSSSVPRAFEAPPGVVNKLFYLVNASGSDVRVRVRANDREVLVEAMPARARQRSDLRTVPSADVHPTIERKIRLREETERLEVEEMLSGRKASFDIGREWMRGPGFRITIGERDIQLVQDYYPVRH